MRTRGMIGIAALAGAAYWASKQPGGMQGTWSRLQQCWADFQAGQDPVAVSKRFFKGSTEEPAGFYTDEKTPEATLDPYQEPYRDYVTEV